MAVKRKYRLNLRNYGNLPAIMLSQYDEGYALEFEIRDGTDAASDLSAYTVTLKGTRADTLAYSFAGTIANNVLTFVIDTTMTACAGRGTAEIAIKDTANDVLFATFNMPVFVERAAVPEGSIDADVERAQEIAEQVQEIVDNAAAAVSGAAEKWATGQINGTDVPSTDPTYENNAKYYAEQAETAAESIGIDATLTQAGKAADAKKTGDEISALKEGLSEVWNGRTVETVGINKLNPAETKADTGLNSINGAEVTATTYTTSGFIPLDTDKTHIGVSGLNANLSSRVWLPVYMYCFYNKEKAFLSYIEKVPSKTIIEIPQGASFARIMVMTEYYEERQMMVELINDTSEKSSVFVEYEEITTGYRGLSQLNRQMESLVSRMETVEGGIADVGEVTEQVEKNTVSISEIIGSAQTLDNLATFANGSIRSSTGTYTGLEQYKNRIATPDITVVPYDIKITITAGYRFYVAYFNSDVFERGAWESSGAILNKDQQVRLMIARKTESTSETADLTEFCSAVTYQPATSIGVLKEEIDYATSVIDSLNIGNDYGLTWDWWITCNSVDTFGNAYIGFVNTNGYAGVIRRQPDGTMQYKVLEKLNDDDDHNACATTVLDDGRILVIGSYGHTTNNHIICWRSTKAYSIDDMEKLSFDIPQGDYTYRTCYSQVFKYNGILFDFLRFGSVPAGQSSGTYGYACLVSADNGDTWTVYKVFNNTDAYNAMAQCTDDDRYIKVVVAGNPGGGTYTFKGCYIDLSTYNIYDLSDTEIGAMVALDGGSIVDERCANYADMTALIPQTQSGLKGRLFFTGKATKASTIFLYATAVDAASSDFIYKEYRDGTVIELGHSGIGFGNVHYISGACLGNDVDTVYYSKATTSKADGAHELHKVKISNNAVASDEIITEASMCILRPLFLGNGELATVVGHYNDQNDDGTYNGSFTAWELKPLFTHA